MDGDVVELGALLDVLEVGLRGRQGELVLVHVGDVAQDVVPPPLGDHLTGSQTQRRETSTSGVSNGVYSGVSGTVDESVHCSGRFWYIISNVFNVYGPCLIKSRLGPSQSQRVILWL